MDGPNANWSVVDKMSSPGQQMELPSFFNVGCCGLHTVHGAFQTGIVAANWLLVKVQHGMWKLLRARLLEGTLTSPLPAQKIFPEFL